MDIPQIPWQTIAFALAVLAALATVLGVATGAWRRGWTYIQRKRTQVFVSIVREGEGDWTVRAVVAVRARAPPIQLYSLTGTAVPQFADAGASQVPVLLYEGPQPKLVRVESFSYRVDHLPLPPKNAEHLLTLWLVGDGFSITRAYHVGHDGGWRLKVPWYSRPLQKWRDARLAARLGL